MERSRRLRAIFCSHALRFCASPCLRWWLLWWWLVWVAPHTLFAAPPHFGFFCAMSCSAVSGWPRSRPPHQVSGIVRLIVHRVALRNAASAQVQSSAAAHAPIRRRCGGTLRQAWWPARARHAVFALHCVACLLAQFALHFIALIFQQLVQLLHSEPTPPPSTTSAAHTSSSSSI